MPSPQQLLTILTWAPRYERANLRNDLAAGLTVGAMLVPQAMAYALLAGLPPEIGLYAATVPVLIYALFGTSRQLAVGPVAIVSLLTATALAPLVEEGTAAYLGAAALLALMVGVIHLVLAAGRLGFLVNFLSHAVLVGFTAAAAVIIGFSQAKHLFGITTERKDHFTDTVGEFFANVGDTNSTTLAIGLTSLTALFAMKRLAPRIPAALVVVVGSILAVEGLDLESRGVKVVGDIPDSLPAFALPTFSNSLIGDLAMTALVITLVGFMESIAVAKVYARRHRYDVDANRELVGLGAANVASGLFGGYPVTGGFSRTAVNDTAGARTPLASIVTAAIVLATIAFLTPLFASLPNAALGAIIIMAIVGLIDIAEMRHIAKTKKTDLISLSVAFGATLLLGIELGILVAVVASMLVVFARMSTPHSAVLGHVVGTTSYRNIDRFPETATTNGLHIVRVDAAVSFVNATTVKKRLLDHADLLTDAPKALVLDASGINDLDATGADMIDELIGELDDRGVTLHLTEVKGPVRDVLRNAGLWDRLGLAIHTSTSDAVAAITSGRSGPADQRLHGIDERQAGAPASPDGTSRRTVTASPGSPSDTPTDTWTDLLDAQQRRELALGADATAHAPKAAILACSDARVPPELIFDQPAGELFVVRIAGNSATPSAMASLDYAVSELDVDLLIVLGHTGCGAVAAAASGTCTGPFAPIVESICDIAEQQPGATTDDIVRTNVATTITTLLRHDGPTGAAARQGRLQIRGAVYDLHSGLLEATDTPSHSISNPTIPA